MARYHATIRSRRPAPETFDYMATFSNASQWDPGVIYQVTRYAPHREVMLDAASRLLRATDSILVAPDGAGATVSYAADVALRGPLRLLDPLLRRGFRAVGDRGTAGLARTLSAPAAQDPAAGLDSPAPDRQPGS